MTLKSPGSQTNIPDRVFHGTKLIGLEKLFPVGNFLLLPGLKVRGYVFNPYS
jgi:hypothetical protein